MLVSTETFIPRRPSLKLRFRLSLRWSTAFSACQHAGPLAAIDALGEAVYHFHAKDTFLNASVQATTSRLQSGSIVNIAAPSWSYIKLCYGHGESC
ncbi:hypothetical protein FHT80_001968 [Rhizobium sp. BK226]|jgi:hypothetical protein|nr:hypothetical protein [Rhizobium anhuiense]MBB4112649.1 hypothetical protein [Rhizobium sp. BK226]MBB4252607.1 hypothetical protein [Rhizobium sp. BK008]GGD74476.1 hypothetical protein GCM10008012_18200 [Rhizobium anhuiense]